jgi:hypothetical protein
MDGSRAQSTAIIAFGLIVLTSLRVER